MITWQFWRLSKISVFAVVAVFTSLGYSYILIYLERGGLSRTSNVNLNLSESDSLGPIVSGILYIRLNNGGDGLLEISGSVKWYRDTYPYPNGLIFPITYYMLMGLT